MRIDRPYDIDRTQLDSKQRAASTQRAGTARVSGFADVYEKAKNAEEAKELLPVYGRIPDVRASRIGQSQTKLSQGVYFTRAAAEGAAEGLLLEAHRGDHPNGPSASGKNGYLDESIPLHRISNRG